LQFGEVTFQNHPKGDKIEENYYSCKRYFGKNMRINLISGPRNISTALMYSFAQRPDTQVVDEPFYAWYLKVSGADHPGRAETLESMSSDLQDLIQQWIFGSVEKEHLFIKNMAHHLIMKDVSFLRNVQNIFLIRNPENLIRSFAKVISNPNMKDIGLQQEWKLFKWIEEETGKTPLVLDSEETLKDPEIVLDKVCKKLGIPFYSDMLQWEPGPRPEDGVWAKYWYGSLHKSSGFLKPENSQSHPFPEQCKSLLEEAIPYYELLRQHSIRN
jgi:hypothetical protein